MRLDVIGQIMAMDDGDGSDIRGRSGMTSLLICGAIYRRRGLRMIRQTALD